MLCYYVNGGTPLLGVADFSATLTHTAHNPYHLEQTDAVLSYGQGDFSLRVPEFSVAKGEVVAVVGRVGSGERGCLVPCKPAGHPCNSPRCCCCAGCRLPYNPGNAFCPLRFPPTGKSSVLQALLSKMQAERGSVSVGGLTAYVPQVRDLKPPTRACTELVADVTLTPCSDSLPPPCAHNPLLSLLGFRACRCITFEPCTVSLPPVPTIHILQSPWVQNLSLRDNITFGLPFDAARYAAVVHACALELDLKILPNGESAYN